MQGREIAMIMGLSFLHDWQIQLSGRFKLNLVHAEQKTQYRAMPTKYLIVDILKTHLELVLLQGNLTLDQVEKLYNAHTS